uniref:39S ribosomal protein L18, mitochondrial n=1 Tax=Rhabditophanes sp. KR3021 TaxID=114890 RepID=A0AC35UCK9_9BILA
MGSTAKALRFIGNADYSSEGKFMFEILCQLRNMGVGRIVTRTDWIKKWPTESSYIKIVKARPTMDPWQQQGTLWAEWIFRGHNLGIYEFSNDLNRSDWKLVPKNEETTLLSNSNKMEEVVFPKTFPLPPLQTHMAKKYADKNKIEWDAKNERSGLDLVIDPQFEMLHKLIAQKDIKKGKSIYEEVDRESIMQLYGKMLPTKVEAWSTGPAKFTPRFHPEQ